MTTIFAGQPTAPVQATDRTALLKQLAGLERRHQPPAAALAETCETADAACVALSQQLLDARRVRAEASRARQEASRVHRSSRKALTDQIQELADPKIGAAIDELDRRHEAITDRVFRRAFGGAAPVNRGHAVFDRIRAARAALEQMKSEPFDREQLARLSAVGDDFV